MNLILGLFGLEKVDAMYALLQQAGNKESDLISVEKSCS